ncbi:MAG: antibiotic biosynthesis monooxygenase family protein [Actinomycetota bacterium]
MTVLSFERYPVDPKQTERFETLVNELLAIMRTAPGALWADAGRAFDDEPSYLLLSEWRTDADLDAWLASDTPRGFGDAVDAALRGDITRRRFATG